MELRTVTCIVFVEPGGDENRVVQFVVKVESEASAGFQETSEQSELEPVCQSRRGEEECQQRGEICGERSRSWQALRRSVNRRGIEAGIPRRLLQIATDGREYLLG